MKNLNDKTTIYLEPAIKKFIKHKAVAENSSLSGVINDHFADMLEDLYDIEEIEKRRNEPTVSFEEVLKDLGLSYDDLRD